MKSENFVVSALFAASLIAGVSLGLIGAVDSRQADSISKQENRALAQLPQIKSVRRDLPLFPQSFENFYNDHFLFRLQLCILRNAFDYLVLQTSGNSSVAIGQNHWLFYAVNKLPTVQQNLDSYEEAELKGAVKTFAARRDLLATHGIKYFVVIAPEKGTIYQNLLPLGWRRRPQAGRLEQLQSEFDKQHIDYVDAKTVLTNSLQDEKVAHQLYFSDDSHWNKVGAFLVAQQLFRQLHSHFAQLIPFQAGEYSLKEDSHAGDLATLLGLQKIIIDKSSNVVDIIKRNAQEVDNSRLPRFESGVTETFNEPKAYCVSDKRMPRAFVFHDSFMELMWPFLVEKFSFSEYHLARSLNPAVVINEKPDVVIDEIAERHLYDRGFDNIATFITSDLKKDDQPKDVAVASFQKQWQLLSVKPTVFKHSLGIELRWRALSDSQLEDRVQVSILDGKSKEVKGVTEYKQDMMGRSVKAGQQWCDVVPVSVFSNSNINQIGIMIVNKSGALYCESPQCDYKVRAIVDFQSAKSEH